MSDVGIRRGKVRLALALPLVVALGLAHAQSAAVTPESEFQKRIKVSEQVQPIGEHPFGETISLYNGALSFEENDIRLSGQGPDIELTRSFHPADVPPDSVYYNFIDNAFVDWSLETPRIETLSAASSTANEEPPPDAQWFFISDSNRCSAADGASDEFVSFKGTVITYPADDWWHGYQLIVPGQGTQDLLKRDTTNNTHAPAVTDTGGNAIIFPLTTKSLWAVGCTAATANGQPGEGFIAVAPDGTKYYMDVLLFKKTDGITEGGGGALHRRVATMAASRVVDRFGNSVSYTYDANGNLTEVDGSDGRQVTLTYESWQNPFKDTGGNYFDPPGYRIHSITVQPASAAPRTWTYTYDTTTDPVIPRLSAVTLPDSSSWQFHLGEFTPLPGDGSQISYQGCDYTKDPVAVPPSSGWIQQPSGLTGTFTLQSIIRGRSNVPKVCLNATSSPQLRFPATYKANALVGRTLTGAGIGTQTWTYTYSAPNDSWTCTGACDTTVSTQMVDPSNRMTRYTFSNAFDASESLLKETDFYTTPDASTLIRSELRDYVRPPNGNSDLYKYPTILGLPPGQITLNTEQMGHLTPVNTKTITQDGDTFYWTAQSFDAFANPTQVTRVSSVTPTQVLVESMDYDNDEALWVQGLPKTVTNVSNPAAPEVESVNAFSALDQLQSRSRFGQTLMSYTYDGAGQLASFTDGLGTHTTNLSGYQRGIPTLITYPDQTTEQIAVNAFGEVAAVTDQNGNATTYNYDAAGRVAQVNYPGGDSVNWAPKVLTFNFVSTAEAGVDGGHWRRTVTQGDNTATNYTQVTYFDALLRPMVAQRYRTLDDGLPATTVTAHDWQGNLTFQSYAVTGLQSYLDVTTGVTTNYDGLSRPIQTIQPSEPGQPALVTTITYLAGARKEVTDPNGNTTTTTYQVFDQPDMRNAVTVEAPEAVRQDIARNLYGEPISVTQGAHTKSIVYDAYHRACRSIEPETQSTVTSYDAANNVVWSAKGQAIGADTVECAYDQVLAAEMISRKYDERNRLTQVTYGDGATPESDFTYTPSGKLLSQSLGLGASTVRWLFTYNKRDLVTGQSLSVDGYVWPVGYGYDVNGVLAAVTYPDQKAVPLAPDAFGRPTQAGSYATSASYYPDDALEQFTLGNGVSYTAGRNARQLMSDFSYMQGTTTVLGRAVTYDPDANITALSDLADTTRPADTFGYDGLNRLTTAISDHWGADVYTYDNVNNLTNVVSGSDSDTNNYTYDQHNKLVSIGGGSLSRTISYDPHGNVTTNGTEQYTFDQADRMTTVDGSVDKYTYDANGRRVKAVVAGVTVYSLYTHDGKLLWQFAPTTNSGTKYIYLGNKLVARTTQVLVPVAPTLTVPPTGVAKTAYAVSWTATPATTSYELEEEPDGGAWTTIYTGTALSKPITQTGAGTFHYQARACNAGGCGNWSAMATIAVAPAPTAPVAPASVSATVAGNLASITVTWSSSPTATSYTLQQQFNSGAFADVSPAPGTNTTATIANPADGTYVYQARACNSAGCSVWVASVAVHVAHIPPAPASISVPGASTGVLGISWPAVAYATSYSLEQSTNNVNYGAVYNGAATSASIGVGATGVYYYRVKGCNANGCGPYSPVGTSSVTIPPSQAPAISGPGSSSNGCYTINWGGVPGATSYVMQENTNGVGWVTIGNNGSGALGICGKGNGTYYYQVQGCNVGGCGPFSGVVAVTVALIPAPPTNLTASTIRAPSKMEAVAVWNASAGATSYQLTAKITPEPESGDGLIYNGPNTTALVFPQGVNATVVFTVKACNANGCSANSNSASTQVANGN